MHQWSKIKYESSLNGHENGEGVDASVVAGIHSEFVHWAFEADADENEDDVFPDPFTPGHGGLPELRNLRKTRNICTC